MHAAARCIFGLALFHLSLNCGDALAGCDPATNAEAVREARQGIEQLNRITGAIRDLGVPVPPRLLNAVNVLSRAMEAGVDLGEAAGEADYQVQQIVANRHSLCDQASSDSDERFICYARIDRQWQARNVNAVLNVNNPGSVVRRAAAKWMGSRCDRSQEAAAPPASAPPAPAPPAAAPSPPPAPQQAPLNQNPQHPAPAAPLGASPPQDNSPPRNSTVTGTFRADHTEAPSPPLGEALSEDQQGGRRGPGGVKIDASSTGRTSDMSDVRQKVLQMKPQLPAK